jgi:peroxiredoxin
VVEASVPAVETLEGAPRRIVPEKGRVTLVVFVTMLCGRFSYNCEPSLSEVEAVYREFREKGVDVFAVEGMDRALVMDELARKNPRAAPLFLDPKERVEGVYGVLYLNESFVFDRQGRFAGRSIRRTTEGQLRELVKKVGI